MVLLFEKLKSMIYGKPWMAKFLSFLTVGSLVTLASLTTNFILLKYFLTPLILTYVSVYASSILVSYLLNSYYTFKIRFSIFNLIKYYAVYLIAMGVGVALLHIYKQLFSFENWVYPFMVLPFTVVINFNLAHRFLRN